MAKLSRLFRYHFRIKLFLDLLSIHLPSLFLYLAASYLICRNLKIVENILLFIYFL
jgi:hypothetical protein